MIYVFTRNNSLRIAWNSALSNDRKAANWESWRPLARRTAAAR